MKKNLLLSSALVAAGLFVAGDAFAQAKPISLSVGGYWHFFYQYTSQDDRSTGLPAGAVAQGGVARKNDAMYNDGEIHFKGSTTLDNGLQVGFQVEYEGDNTADQVDEIFMDFRGSFGRVVLGQFDGAAREMQRVAPSGSRSYLNGINEWGWITDPLTGGNTSYTATSTFNAGDAEKIVYFSPVFSGFQAGVSWAPQGAEQNAGLGPAAGSNVLTANNAGLGSYWDAMITYAGKFSDVGLNAGLGYQRADVQGAQTLYRGAAGFTGATAVHLDPVDTYLGYLIFDIGAFSVGGSFSVIERDLRTLAGGAALPAGSRSSVTDLTYDLGVSYTTGPWKVGASYLRAELESQADSTNAAAPPTVSGELKVDKYIVNASYLLGPGLTVESGVVYEKLDFSGNQPNEDGWAVFIGTRLGF